MPEVDEHAREDLTLARGGDHARVEHGVGGRRLLEERLEVRRGQRATPGVRVEEQPGVLDRDAHEEVTGEVHTLGEHAHAARDLEVDDRERDRNADPPVEDLAQKAVARVVVVGGVAREAEVVEQAVADRLRAHDAGLGALHGRRRARRDLVEQRAIAFQIAPRIFPGTDQQSCLVEREVVPLHHRGEGREPLANVHGGRSVSPCASP